MIRFGSFDRQPSAAVAVFFVVAVVAGCSGGDAAGVKPDPPPSAAGEPTAPSERSGPTTPRTVSPDATAPTASSPSPTPTAPVTEAFTAVLERLIAAPDDASLLIIDTAGGSWSHRADVVRPVGSVFKTLVLAAYANVVAAGWIDPDEIVPIDEIETWLVEGTDGGSHAQMVEMFGTDAGVRLDDLAAAMMALSANTATDVLLTRLGQPAVVAAATRLGVPELAGMVAPTAAAVALIADPEFGPDVHERIGVLSAMDRYAVADAAWAGVDDWELDPGTHRTATLAALSQLTTWEDQLEFSSAMPFRATAAELGQLMWALVGSRQLSTEATTIVERHMAWPLADPGVATRFTMIAAKDGAIPGSLSVIAAGVPSGGAADGEFRVVVFSVHDLDPETWTQMYDSLAVQFAALDLLNDPTLTTLIDDKVQP